MNKTVVSPFAIIWFCNAKDPSKISHDYDNSMLPVIHSNRIFNANGTGANVTCELLALGPRHPLQLDDRHFH